MASSSTYSHPEPTPSSSRSCNCDVFLSFRGEDTRKTFVDHLYSALVDRKISTYKDDETLPRGESIRPSLLEAIEASQIAVIIFSENYVDSSWCLEELAHIMKCKDERKLIVMPVFYDVVPSEVRKQEGEFGRGFAKQKARNINKVEIWRQALVDASEIAGWELLNLHESKDNDKIEAIQYAHYFTPGQLSRFCKIVSNMKKLRWLSLNLYNSPDETAIGPTFLSNELRYIGWHNYPRSPFTDQFQPMKLVTLKLSTSLQKQLWKGYKHLPRLKVLVLQDMKNLLNTPNFDGLPCLQKLILEHCKELQEIHPSLAKHTSVEYAKVSYCVKLRMFPAIVHMGKLETLEITYCHKSLEFPDITSNMESLRKLYLADIYGDNSSAIVNWTTMS
ncbi:hypothetical protein QVD17_16212 [Tagetes erecta]|uniref:TIR domain-containing protein n=1 Tax=Tagetes erecta TaxID=13708 RepID=A0AAD8KXE6_TARER|nr:hypothetical protein QVD17_16212 [Tagetes erecta]